MDRDTREALARNFDASGNDPRTWLWVAGNLRTAAAHLEPHFPLDFRKETQHERIVVGARLQGPILMLRGCELECLLKAILKKKRFRNVLAIGGRPPETPNPEKTETAGGGSVGGVQRPHFALNDSAKLGPMLLT